jgi:hypothetical protein
MRAAAQSGPYACTSSRSTLSAIAVSTPLPMMGFALPRTTPKHRALAEVRLQHACKWYCLRLPHRHNPLPARPTAFGSEDRGLVQTVQEQARRGQHSSLLFNLQFKLHNPFRDYFMSIDIRLHLVYSIRRHSTTQLMYFVLTHGATTVATFS